jgi:hypothetical protein
MSRSASLFVSTWLAWSAQLGGVGGNGDTRLLTREVPRWFGLVCVAVGFEGGGRTRKRYVYLYIYVLGNLLLGLNGLLCLGHVDGSSCNGDTSGRTMPSGTRSWIVIHGALMCPYITVESAT